MYMDINQRTAKIPFWVLYGLAAIIVSFDAIYTYTFLSNNPNAHEGNPINAYFASIIGLEYFLFLIPIILPVLYGAIKFGAWILRHVDKYTEINGENCMAVLIILLTFPNVLINEIFTILLGKWALRLSFEQGLVSAAVLITVYLTLAEIADRKFKKKQIENAQVHASI
jgi:hypothetical protein